MTDKAYGPLAVNWRAYLPPLNAGSTLFAWKGPDAQFIALIPRWNPILKDRDWLIVYQP